MRSAGFEILTAAAFVFAASTFASAEPYPSKYVSIITHVAAGSGPDVVLRLFAERLSRVWGEQVTVVNRPGAAGLIASQAAAAAIPDGYTLYMATISGVVISPETQANFQVDFERDFTPIGHVGSTPMMIAVSSKLGVNTLADLIAFAKRRPGEVLYAGNNRGSFPHLTGELLRSRSGIDLSFIPYQGAAAALKDVLGGTVSMMIESPSAMPGATEGGAIKALAVTSAARLPAFPDLPSVSETFPGFLATGWFVLLAPKGTPESIVQKISQNLDGVIADPAIVKKLGELGVDAQRMSPSETAAFIRSQRETWRPVIKAAGLSNQ